MTCIVGLVDKDQVWIGGDSAGVDTTHLSLAVRADRKVFRNGPFVMGFTSSFRMGQLLAHALKPPRRHAGDDVMTFMVVDFVNAVRTCLQQGGYARKNNEEESAGTFLVGYEGRLFNIESDYQVGESVRGFHAVGCGAQIAIGAMHASAHVLSASDRIEAALEAAEEWNAGVRAPFHIEHGGERTK